MAPNRVSGRVVNTSMTSGPAANRMVAPSDRPIQLRWIVLMASDQSSSSRSSSNRSAYAVMRIIHCFKGRRKTGWLPRSLRPSLVTSSLASTVPRAGHQFTGTSARYARRCPSTTTRRSTSSSSSQLRPSGVGRRPAASSSTSSAIGLARPVSGSHHALKICRKIHCVHR